MININYIMILHNKYCYNLLHAIYYIITHKYTNNYIIVIFNIIFIIHYINYKITLYYITTHKYKNNYITIIIIIITLLA